MNDHQNAVLLLEDGTVFRGRAGGVSGTVTGEICFNTGMTGYQEIFTDPSYFGQIMVMTNAHIGNYGTHDIEMESAHAQISGLVCRNFTIPFSRSKASRDIQSWCEQHKLVVVHSVDTRALVLHIRNKGAMNAIISTATDDLDLLSQQLAAVPSMASLELASRVTTPSAYLRGDAAAQYRIALMDYGVKQNIMHSLVRRGCYLKVFPATAGFDEIMAFNPDGIMLSNGPGDPAAMDYAIQPIQQMLESGIPVFGICLGHQLLARAIGLPTYKMKHGHRGINHPVQNIIRGKSEITSQNHGFCVDPEAIRQNADKVEITHINLNDDTIEGIRLKGKPAFSVQYHPEASPGPHDSRYLFDDFIAMISEHKHLFLPN